MQILLAALLAGVAAGLVLLVVQILDIPLGPGGSPFGVIAMAAAFGAMIGGPWALLCGGLVRLLVERRGWQEGATAVFAGFGLLGGLLFVTILFGANGATLHFNVLFAAALAGLAGGLAYRAVMPPIRRSTDQES